MQTYIYTHNGIKQEKKTHARILGEGNVLGIILECGYSFTKCNTNNILENETNSDWSLLYVFDRLAWSEYTLNNTSDQKLTMPAY